MSTPDAGAGAAIDARGNPQAWNMRLVGHCPMEGRGDGMHINLKDGYAFFAHMGDFGLGTSIVEDSVGDQGDGFGRLCQVVERVRAVALTGTVPEEPEQPRDRQQGEQDDGEEPDAQAPPAPLAQPHHRSPCHPDF